MLRRCLVALLLFVPLTLLGCDGGRDGVVPISGSSTVYPATRVLVVDFGDNNPGYNVTLGESGSGGGFTLFSRGEISINNSSRPIAEREKRLAAENGVEYIELPVAYDGLTVIVHPDNPVERLTLEQVDRIFRHGSDVTNWNQLDPDFPDLPLSIHMRSEASGTYDFFLHRMLGRDAQFRADIVSKNVQSNVVAAGISGERGSVGFLGYAFYKDNADTLKAVALPNAEGNYVTPSAETIRDLEYLHLLARPLFIYVNKEHAETRAGVAEFVDHYLERAAEMVPISGYVPLAEEDYELVRKRWQNRVTGTMFGSEAHEKPLRELLLEHQLRP